MQHEEAVRQHATEKYILDELDPDQRDQFEEHFFDCPDCASDVRAAAMFVEHSKEMLAERPAESYARQADLNPPKKRWLGWLNRDWLRAAFAVPAIALLLLIVGYQNLVQVPRLRSAASQPRVLPAISLNLLTYGSASEPITITPGQSFLVNVILPPGDRYSSYQVDLYNPKGKIDTSLPVRAVSSASTWPIQIPGADRESGSYKLAVQGRTAEGQTKEVGSSSFELQILR